MKAPHLVLSYPPKENPIMAKPTEKPFTKPPAKPTQPEGELELPEHTRDPEWKYPAVAPPSAPAPAPSSQRPSPGRVVLVRIAKDVYRPAIVVRVLDQVGPKQQTVVNLQVFFDGSNDDPLRPHKWPSFQGEWITNVVEGSELGQWSWPPRV